MGRKPIAGKAMSGAERVRKHRQKRQEAWRPSRSRDAERFRNWLEQSKPEDIAAFAGLSLQANVTQTAEPLHADVTELKRRLAESEAENARLKAATGGAEPLQAEVTELRRRLEECEVSRDQARAECSSASQMVAYFEGAQSGVFNKKTFNLIRDCLFPDKQHLETSPERRAQFNSALAAFNANAKVLLKPEPRVRPAGQALPTAEEMMRRRGEYDRQQKEKRAKAAAARKARKQPKRALNHVNG